jgi:hypothetical protein
MSMRRQAYDSEIEGDDQVKRRFGRALSPT